MKNPGSMCCRRLGGKVAGLVLVVAALLSSGDLWGEALGHDALPAGVGGSPEAGGSPESVDEVVEEITDSISFKTNFSKGLQCVELPLSTKLSLDFDYAEVIHVIKFISCITGKTILTDKPFAKSKVTLLSPEPVTVYEAYKAFLATLRAHGWTMVKKGPVYEIVKSKYAGTSGAPIISPGEGIPKEDRIVTVVLPIHHADATTLSQTLGTFVSGDGEVTAHAPTNSLIITDHGTNFLKLKTIIAAADVPGDIEKIWVRQLLHADASVMMESIQSVFEKEKKYKKKKYYKKYKYKKYKKYKKVEVPNEDPGPANVTISKMVADERTNKLILVCNKESYYKVDKLIRKLDIPMVDDGSIHVHYLANADAEEVASTLSSIIDAGSKGKSKYKYKKYKKKSSKKSSSLGGASFAGEVEVTADTGTNSLVVQASKKDYQSLLGLIEKLDIQRKQVFVEAVIMEITSTKETKIDFSGSGGTTFELEGETVPLMLGLGGLGVSGLDTSQLTKGGIAAGLQGPLLDMDAGSLGSSTTAGSFSIPAFGFVFQAIRSNSDVNILSTPHILTLDNEEAELQVGKQIPYRSSSYGGMSSLYGMGTGSTAAYGSSAYGTGSYGYSPYSMLGGLGGMGMIQRIDVDLSLKITPHVNEGDFVTLEIEQSVEDVESLDAELGPTTSKRKISNTVVVEDQQPVVIGGLIRETESEAVDKIPFFGDIPLLGVFFRTTVSQVEKKNLVLVITPTVIEDPSDLAVIHAKKQEEIKAFLNYLTLETVPPEADIDYDKKHGLLETINQHVAEEKKAAAIMEEALYDSSDDDVLGPPETHDIEYDPTKDVTKTIEF